MPRGNPFNITLPVETVHVGGTIVPITGAVGVEGCAFITTSGDATEVHVEAFVTVNVYVPATSPETVQLVRLPFIVAPPGFPVNVQVPAGNPLSTTLPVDSPHVGCVIVPITGGVGVAGCELITTLADTGDVQFAALVTVKVYVVAAASPLIVVLVPVPVVVVPPGERVNVQVPVEGKPFNTTLPVATLQVGWVIVPTTGAEGIEFTVNVYVADAAVQGNVGVLVVTVMVTTLPASAATGV